MPKKKAVEVSSFFKKHKAPGAERAITQVVEKIYANYEWLSRDEKGIEEYVKIAV